jgi:hypothetical protein
MKLNNKIYCDVCCKRIDNYTDPEDCITYGIVNQERHYCKRHNNVGEKMRSIYCKEDMSLEEAIKEFNEKVKEKFNKIKEKESMSVDPNKIQVDWTKATKENILPLTSCDITIPPMPPVKPPKEERIKRIYEDDDFIIDLFVEDKMVRASVFKDGHFKDEVFVKWEDYIE